MRLILLGFNGGRSHSIQLRRWHLWFGILFLSAVLLATAGLGYQQAAARYEALPGELLAKWRQEVEAMRAESLELQSQSRQERQAYAIRLATLQARLVRLDALGDRLTDIAGLDEGEFDFSREPALGGPESRPVPQRTPPELDELLAQLDQKLADREDQLAILEGLIHKRNLQTETTVAGRPVLKGWMSSAYGRRTDPFHGGQAWHQGVDFAGREGAEVVAVAAGVVTWSGDRSGYGDMVEVSHADGYVTRYAHNRDNLVSVGEVVKKGQQIARMGSSGRSTGPHVHFEVFRNGKAVNPAAYIYRASR